MVTIRDKTPSLRNGDTSFSMGIDLEREKKAFSMEHYRQKFIGTRSSKHHNAACNAC